MPYIVHKKLREYLETKCADYVLNVQITTKNPHKLSNYLDEFNIAHSINPLLLKGNALISKEQIYQLAQKIFINSIEYY